MPFVLYVCEVTPAFVSFSIPNNEENYIAFMKLIEPILHPSIVEVQQLPWAENIFIRIAIDALNSNLERYMHISSKHNTLDPDSAVREAQNIINSTM